MYIAHNAHRECGGASDAHAEAGTKTDSAPQGGTEGEEETYRSAPRRTQPARLSMKTPALTNRGSCTARAG